MGSMQMCWIEIASRMGGGQAACTHCTLPHSFLVFGKPLMLPRPAGTQLWGSQWGWGAGNEEQLHPRTCACPGELQCGLSMGSLLVPGMFPPSGTQCGS